jgi:hypothetical protein
MEKSINYKRINPPVNRELSCNHARLSPSQRAGGFVRLKRSGVALRPINSYPLKQADVKRSLWTRNSVGMAGVGYDNFGNKGVEKATGQVCDANPWRAEPANISQ